MKKLFLLLLAVLSLSLCASAQMRTVQGTVIDAENDEPLVGASVQAGKGIGVSTNYDGEFSIRVPQGTATLTVSYVGYNTQEVKITDGNMVIRLESNNTLLDPVIVVAYGEQKKSSFTGSAATVGSATIEKTQVNTVLDALSGRVPGLQLSNASGSPTSSGPSMAIRGFSSLNAGNSPLIIVDGTPYTGDIQALNTNDIESMTVLKDAASNALYGARGANGVILITTKRARLGEAKVTVDAKWGANTKGLVDYDYIKDPGQYYEAAYAAIYNYNTASSDFGGKGMTPEQAFYASNETLASSNGGGLGYIVYDYPQGQYLIGRDGKLNPNATLGRKVTHGGKEYYLTPDNWMKEIYGTGLRQEYNVNITQGTEKSNIMVSVGYLKNDGIIVSPSYYERFSGRVAADFQAKPWLKVGVNASYSHANYQSMSGQEGSSNATSNLFAYASQTAPIYPVYVRDGQGNIMWDEKAGMVQYDYGNGMNAGLTRPLFSDFNGIGLNLLDKDKSSDNQLTATAFAEIRFLKDFKFTTNNNVNLLEVRSLAQGNPYYGSYIAYGGMNQVSHTRNTDYTFQQLLNWNHLFNNRHNVSVLVGHEWYKSVTATIGGAKSGIFLPSNMELDGAIVTEEASSATGEYNNEGWLMRAMYDLDSKYFFSGSFRRDASSNFHPDHRWGNFWSLGGAWIISKEDFFNADWVNLLKFKVSYGEQGNDNIGSFRYVDTYTLINANGHPAAQPATKGNKDITWEKNGNFNVGVEFELFNTRLNGSIDGFYRTTHDMLMQFPLPASSGFMGYYDNIGNMMNAGIELDLQATPIRTRDFTWTIGLNMTWYKNKIVKLPDERKASHIDRWGELWGYTSGSTAYLEDIPMYTYWMKKNAGVDPVSGKSLYYMDEYEIDPDTKQPILDEEGERIYTGKVITTDDYDKGDNYLCGTALAPVYGGFNTMFEYKGFDLSFAFNYQIGGQVYDSGYQALMTPSISNSAGSNIHADVFKAWTAEKPSNTIPRWQYNDNNVAQTQSRFLTDASYLSLQQINFGYTLPDNVVKKLFLNKLRVYFAAENIWVWSQRQGLDPRQSFTGGNNINYYAPMRTFSGGFTLSF